MTAVFTCSLEGGRFHEFPGPVYTNLTAKSRTARLWKAAFALKGHKKIPEKNSAAIITLK